jgi:WD40 repeat protein
MAEHLKVTHDDYISCAAFTQDGRFLLLASGTHFCTRPRDATEPGRAQLWNVETGKPASPVIPHPGGVRGGSFDPANRRFHTAGNDGWLRIHSVETGEEERAFNLKSCICTTTWSSDGTMIIVLTLNKKLRFLDAETGEDALPPSTVKRIPMFLGLSPNGRWLKVSGGVDILIIDTKTGKLETKFSHRLRVTSSRWLSDDVLLTASDDYVIREWDVRKEAVAREVYRTPRWIWSLSCSEDGTRLLIGTEDEAMRAGNEGRGHAEIIDIDSGQRLTPNLEHAGSVSARFMPDERQILTCSTDGFLCLWDAKTGERLAHWKHGFMSTNFLFSPTGDVLVLRGREAELMPPIEIPSMKETGKETPREATPPKKTALKKTEPKKTASKQIARKKTSQNGRRKSPPRKKK